MKRCAFVAMLLIAHPARADEPPGFPAYDVESGRYIAEIRAARGEHGRNAQDWHLTIYEIPGQTGGARREVWALPYEHPGYAGGLLSDDGTVFVYVEQWYHRDRSVVSIYRMGAPVLRVPGSTFNITPDPRMRTVSHELWLARPAATLWNAASFDWDPPAWRIDIHGADGFTRTIETATGNLLRSPGPVESSGCSAAVPAGLAVALAAVLIAVRSRLLGQQRPKAM